MSVVFKSQGVTVQSVVCCVTKPSQEFEETVIMTVPPFLQTPRWFERLQDEAKWVNDSLKQPPGGGQ